MSQLYLRVHLSLTSVKLPARHVTKNKAWLAYFGTRKQVQVVHPWMFGFGASALEAYNDLVDGALKYDRTLKVTHGDERGYPYLPPQHQVERARRAACQLEVGRLSRDA